MTVHSPAGGSRRGEDMLAAVRTEARLWQTSSSGGPIRDPRMIGLGCMRLSTLPERDEGRAIAVIHAALGAGATLLDTADAYGLDDGDIGHNERLVAEALRTWHGDASAIRVATKGGLRRPGGRWVTDGRASHLRAACEASRAALGVETIDLYQLHAVDSRVSLQTSVRALAALQQEGRIRDVGLCNVNVSQIEAAREIVDVAAVQVQLSVLSDESIRNGVVEFCLDHDIALIAHRPLGGERMRLIARDAVLAEIAQEQGCTPQEIALAWLCDLDARVVPIPGATRVDTARSIGRVRSVALMADARARLDRRFPAGRLLRVPREKRRPADEAEGDVVVVMGMPGAGKSTIAEELVRQGYARLNRDTRGGTLAGLVHALDAGLADGVNRWVLDNTYASRADRNDVIESAWRHGVPVRCIHVETTLADAQINAVLRLIEAHGRLPMPEDLRAQGRSDPRHFGPDAQFRYERTMEAPVLDEGWVSIETRTVTAPPPKTGDRRAVFFDPKEITPPQADELRRFQGEGWFLVGITWSPGGDATRPDLSGLDYAFACCTHAAGPPVCWCRKPLPGLFLEAAWRHRLDLERSVIVGSGAADLTLGRRLRVRLMPLAELGARPGILPF